MQLIKNLMKGCPSLKKQWDYKETMSKKMDDSYRHKGLRTKLIEGIREKGITDENVLTAMNHIPRHFFLDVALDNKIGRAHV